MPTKGFLSTWMPLVTSFAMTIPQQLLAQRLTNIYIPKQYKYKKQKQYIW